VLITAADSGIGRAAAIAFAHEGADVSISHLREHQDAQESVRWVEEAGRGTEFATSRISRIAASWSIVPSANSTHGSVKPSGSCCCRVGPALFGSVVIA